MGGGIWCPLDVNIQQESMGMASKLSSGKEQDTVANALTV